MAQVEPTCRPVRGTGCPSSMLMGFLQKHGLHLITFLCPAGMLYPPVCRQIVQSGHVSLMGAWWWVTHALMFECEILLCMGRGEIALPLFDINRVRCSFLPPLAQNVKNTAFPVASGVWRWEPVWLVIHALVFEGELLLCMGGGKSLSHSLTLTTPAVLLLPFPNNVQNAAFPVASGSALVTGRVVNENTSRFVAKVLWAWVEGVFTLLYLGVTIYVVPLPSRLQKRDALYTYTYTYTYTHIHIHIHIHIYLCTYVYVYTCISVYMYMYMCMWMCM